MSDVVIERLGREETNVLKQWLDDAARADIDVTDLHSIDAAYEGYVDKVMDQHPDDRTDPTSFIAMVSFALGQWLERETLLEWRVITDGEGRDIGLTLPDESSYLFPSDFVADAWNEQKRHWLTAWASELRTQLAGLA